MDARILREIALGRGKVRVLLFKAGTKELISASPWSHNKIALNDDHGMNLFLKRHIGDMDYDIEIVSARFGTGSAPRTGALTELTTPYATYFTRSNEYMNSDASCTAEFFVPSASLPNNTYTEFGIYTTGNRYFASALLSPAFVKGDNQDALVQYAITYSV